MPPYFYTLMSVKMYGFKFIDDDLV